MGKEEELQPKESISDVLKKYKEKRNEGIIPTQPISNTNVISEIPKASTFNPQEFEKTMMKETDPDLMTSYEIVKLPSKGLFYTNQINEVNVEYMTSKDEDLLTTPSLLESGMVLDMLLKRKIKSVNVNPEDLLPGDRNAIILFLRSSSYGNEYTVQVTDPRTGVPFKAIVDLLQLKYKEMKEIPDQYGYFTVELPMRKKIITIKLLTAGEETKLFKKSESIKEAYNEEYSQYNTLKLKAHIVAINEKSDRAYIDKFVDAMPALDAFTIRRKIIDISPDVDMSYEFIAKDGFKFKANLTVGIDFFFPQN
jgi:hypothetical protein